MADEGTVKGVRLGFSKLQFATSFVLDLTDIDPMSTVDKQASSMPIGCVHLGELLDYIESGFRVIYNNSLVLDDDEPNLQQGGETASSSAWRESQQHPHNLRARRNVFGGQRKKDTIVPKSEMVPNSRPMILVILGGSSESCAEFHRSLFGTHNIIGFFDSMFESDGHHYNTESVKIISPCMCPLPIVISSKKDSKTTESYCGTSRTTVCDLRTSSKLGLHNENKVFGHCRRSSQFDCYVEYSKQRKGQVGILRYLSSHLAQKVVYIDGRYLGIKGIPALMDTMYSNPSTCVGLFREFPSMGDATNSHLDTTTSLSLSPKDLQQYQADKEAAISRRADSLCVWFDKLDQTYHVKNGSSAVRGILPLDESKQPVESWRVPHVWRDIPGATPDSYTPSSPLAPLDTSTPPLRDLLARELQWAGVVVLSSSALDFWIRDMDSSLYVESATLGQQEILSTQEVLRYAQGVADGQDLITSYRNRTEALVQSCTNAPLTPSLGQSLLEGTNAQLEHRLRETAMSTAAEDKTVDGLIEHLNESEKFALMPHAASERERLQCKISLGQRLSDDDSLLDLLALLTAMQWDERARHWGQASVTVERVCTGEMWPDIYQTMLYASNGELKSVPKPLRPDIYCSSVLPVILPESCMVWKIPNKTLTNQTVEAIKTDISVVSTKLHALKNKKHKAQPCKVPRYPALFVKAWK